MRTSRGTIVAWTLYDFANSAVSAVIVATIWPVYYTNLVVGNATGRGDFWWGLTTSVTMVLVALTSPILGGIADHAGTRKPFFIGLTAVSVVAAGLLATVGPGMVIRGFALGVLCLVGYEAALVYYNAYLPVIARPEVLGRVSAAGFAVGYAGSVAAFLAAYPFAAVQMYGGCFLAVAALFAAFAVPSFVALPADTRHPITVRVAVARGVRETLATLREITRRPERRELRRFLVAYLFYEDGVNTVITFAGVFAAKTLGFTFTEIIGLFMLAQVTALLGSVAWARPIDRRGPRLVVMVTLVQWMIVVLVAFFVETKAQFWIVGILAGTGLGAIQAASRTFMATLVPRGREAEFFGFYSLVGKTGAVMGPLVFGGVSWAMAGNQRAAIVAVGLFFIVGVVLLSRVRAGGPTTPR
ncbi:MAG: MFS transporter [Candidatus Rokubacteria bacterium]|nr:MFS transporter [Candidatus Rokubacteria bacterium]